MRTIRRGAPAVIATLLVLALPAAAAGATTSTNWAGYVAHRTGVRFKNVTATWVQPTATCTPGTDTYSAYWIGLGGYSARSKALEQVGTEADCDVHGKASYYAWYELVPAAEVATRLTVKPGDKLSASVTVSRHVVRLRLADVTRGTAVVKRLHAATVDVSSAEWIVEAPSLCSLRRGCETQPLADFGSVRFSHARATGIRGHVGGVRDRAWAATRIDLVAGGHSSGPGHFAGGAASGGASTADLSPSRTSFAIAYKAGETSTPGPNQERVRSRIVRSGASAPGTRSGGGTA